MTNERATTAFGDAAAGAVVIAGDGQSGVWVDAPTGPDATVLEILAHDGHLTTMEQLPGGALVIRTDGLRDAACAVIITANGSARPITDRR